MRIYFSIKASNNDLKYHYRRKCKWINNIDADNLRCLYVEGETSTEPPDKITIDGTTHIVCSDCHNYERTPVETSEDVRTSAFKSLETNT